MPDMTKKIITILAFTLSISLAGNPVCVAAQGEKNGNSGRNTLVIATVSDNPKKHYRYLKPMVDYAVSHLRDFGITEGKVLLAKNNRQLIEFLRQGRVDWVTETAFAAVICQEQAGAEIILKKWKKGVEKYHTIFFARKESRINSLEQLEGKTIAFEAPDSTSAFYIPYSIMINAGLNPVKLESVRQKAGNDQTGYLFAGEEVNQSAWVYRGLVDAGAFSNTDWDEADNMPTSFRKDMKIFHRSKDFPRAVELVRKNLDPKLKEALITILVDADKSDAGRKALKAYHKTIKIEPLDSESLEGLKEAQRILRNVRPGLNQ